MMTVMRRGQANILILFVIVGVVIFVGSALFKNKLGMLASRTAVTSSGGVVTYGGVGGPAPQTSVPVPTNPAPTTPEPTKPVPPSERDGAVYISSVSPSAGGEKAVVTLRTNLGNGETVDVTGWMLQTNKRRLYIPQAVRVYQMNGVNKESDIVLEKDNTMTLYAGSASSLGYNFRINKCMGYLNKTTAFESPLPNECPVPVRSTYQQFAGWCQNYIQSLGSCALPDVVMMNSWLGDDGNACRDFVNNFFTIDHCYRSLSGGLLDNEWRVWVNEMRIFDPQHDVVKLVNTEGKIVSSYVY